MKNLKLFLTAFLILLILVGLVVLYKRSHQPVNSLTREPNNFKSLSFILDWTPNTNHTGIYVAQSKGWYKDEGIDLKILPYSQSVTPDVLVASGKVDVGISSTESIVADAASGAPVVSIAAVISRNTSALVALNESGIKRPKDLDGKIYGGFGSAFEEPVIGGMIRNDGGTGTFKNVTISVDTLEALKSKKVDFVWIFMAWDGIAATRQHIGLRVFPISQFGIPDYATPNIIASKQTILKKKDLLKKFMRATARGFEYARLHPQESAQILIKSAPAGSFADPQLVIDSQKYLSPLYADSGKKWGVQDPRTWGDYPQFMLKNKAVLDAKGKPVQKLDIDTLFTNEFIK